MSQGQKYLKAALVLASAVCCQTAMSRVQSCEKFVLDDFSFFFLPIFQREWGIYAPWTIEHIHTNVKRQICFTLPARLNKLKMRLGNVDTGYPWCAAILNRKLLLKIAVMKKPPFLSPFQIQTHMETQFLLITVHQLSSSCQDFRHPGSGIYSKSIQDGPCHFYWILHQQKGQLRWWVLVGGQLKKNMPSMQTERALPDGEVQCCIVWVGGLQREDVHSFASFFNSGYTYLDKVCVNCFTGNQPRRVDGIVNKFRGERKQLVVLEMNVLVMLRNMISFQSLHVIDKKELNFTSKRLVIGNNY